jgi:hypothetical protein
MKNSILPRCREEAITVSTGQTRRVYCRASTGASGAKRPSAEMPSSVKCSSVSSPGRRPRCCCRQDPERTPRSSHADSRRSGAAGHRYLGRQKKSQRGESPRPRRGCVIERRCAAAFHVGETHRSRKSVAHPIADSAKFRIVATACHREGLGDARYRLKP